MPDMETLGRLNDYRARISRGEEIPVEELKACLEALRGGRTSAAATSAKSSKSKKPAAPPIDLNSLFTPAADAPPDPDSFGPEGGKE